MIYINLINYYFLLCILPKIANVFFTFNQQNYSCYIVICHEKIFFLLHAITEVPLTFVNISKKLISTFAANNARTFIITFDRYFTPSIKYHEHSLKGRILDQNFCINTPDQLRPATFGTELKNIYF